MRNSHAGIHHYLQTCIACLLRGFFVDNSLLHPDDFCADLDRAIDDRRHIFRLAEDLHYIDLLGHRLQIWICLFAQDLVRGGVDGNDAIALVF